MAFLFGALGDAFLLFGGSDDADTGQTYTAQQNVMNTILQESNQSCTVLASAESGQNTTIVVGSNARTVTGVNQSVSSDITCAITSTMDTQVENMLENASKQTIKDSQGPVGDIIDAFSDSDASGQSVNMSQSVSNSISQITNATCQSSTIASSNNNLLIVVGSNNGDIVGVSTSTSAQATCILQNASKIDLTNALGLLNDQNDTKKSSFWEVVKYLIIGSVIIVALIFLMMIIPSGEGDKMPEPAPATAAAPTAVAAPVALPNPGSAPAPPVTPAMNSMLNY